MDENYLNQLLGGNYFTSSDVTMNYPIWTSTQAPVDVTVKSDRKEVSFIKKELPKFNILTLQYKI